MARPKKDPNDGIFQFLSPQDADAIIKARIATTPKKGGTRKGVWTKTELQIRDNVILDYICKQGLSRNECCKQISDRWQIHMHTAEKYVKEALDRLVADDEEFKTDARTKHIERLENLLQECQDRLCFDQAIKILDQIAKINGLYTDNKNVNISNDRIVFKFDE